MVRSTFILINDLFFLCFVFFRVSYAASYLNRNSDVADRTANFSLTPLSHRKYALDAKATKKASWFVLLLRSMIYFSYSYFPLFFSRLGGKDGGFVSFWDGAKPKTSKEEKSKKKDLCAERDYKLSMAFLALYVCVACVLCTHPKTVPKLIMQTKLTSVKTFNLEPGKYNQWFV